MQRPEQDDEVLVTLLKQGSTHAFETIYRRYWRPLFVFVFHQIGSREEAKEVLQELMLSLWQNRAVSDIRNLKAFLFIAARNLTAKHFRKEINLRKYREYQLMQEVFEHIDTDELFNETQLSAAIEKALESLPEKSASIFRMNKLDEVSVKKIAVQMGLSDRAVEYHLTKSMRVVKEHLRQYFSEN